MACSTISGASLISIDFTVLLALLNSTTASPTWADTVIPQAIDIKRSKKYFFIYSFVIRDYILQKKGCIPIKISFQKAKAQ
jgi:hypothetical protein